MIGIVIVSHSKKLAEGVLELASQMTHGRVVMQAVGGIDDPENPIGTDPMQVMAAIETVAAQSEDGVLVIMDLGSALMSAETALDFIPDETREKVLLCSAPIVEGTVAAAVQASIGASLQEASNEANNALQVKIQQLAPVTGELVQEAKQEVEHGGEVLELELVIHNKLGLHARPAANLVATAGTFESTIQIKKGSETVSAKSINQVALLSVKNNDTITISVAGPDAEDAIAAIKTLYEDHFGERDEDVALPAVTKKVANVAEDGSIQATAGSEGYGLGELYLYESVLPEVERQDAKDSSTELEKLKKGLALAVNEIEQLKRESQRSSGVASAEIFTAHALILQDQDLLDKATKIIQGEQVCCEYGWQKAIEETAEAYRNLDSEYMQARATDIIDCGGRVLRILLGQDHVGVELKKPAVLAAHDLTPSDVAGLDPEMVIGIITEIGTTTSHAAILARSLGIPAVMGVPLELLGKANQVGLDGFSGTVWPDPDDAVRNHLETARTAWLTKRKQAKAEATQPAITSDGKALPILGNIGVPSDGGRVFDYGAQGVGLFRTEFLFQGRKEAPTEDEQVAAYTEAAQQLRGAPVIIRTLDIGGDKPIPYLSSVHEENPFLGQRGIRFCLARPELFRTQLRALLRAAATENIQIMYPMISSVTEFKTVLALQQQVAKELQSEGIPVAPKVKTGLMIEVPSAVAVADKLAEISDFFSIGTNDLTQYTMAADRGNSAVANLCDNLDPAVLRMISATCKAAEKAGIEVGMCGELAGNKAATPLLIGLGLDELSMSGPAIPEVKQAVRKANLKDCKELATKALAADSADEVRALLGIQ